MLFVNCSFGQYSTFKYEKKNHSSDAWYQSTTKESRYITIGGGPLVSTYVGDLTPKDKFIINALKVTRPGFSAFINYNWKAPFSFSGDLFYARIIGDDFNTSPEDGGSTRKYVRNLSFRNDLIGVTARGNFMILKDKFEYFKRLDFNIYLNAGISVYYSNPKAKIPNDSIYFTYAGDWVPLRPLGTEGQNNPLTGVKKYSSVQVGIPVGIGMRFRLGYKTDLYLDASFTYMLSDYIDDIGDKYVDLGALESGVAKVMSDRSKEKNSSQKDEPRDWDLINEYVEPYSYVSAYDGNTYNVFKGFGEDGAMRGGETNEFISSLSFRISYIISN
ncbi:MAG: hypothetical protein U5K79_04350 [Cyclobacteriaceae bacterium]|nr:hypothetical protein [Cyclobacteriaceae bacterium]